MENESRIKMRQVWISFVLLTCICLTVDATLGQGDKKKKKDKDDKPGVTDKSVAERGLIKEKVKWKDIVKEYSSYCEPEKNIKRFTGSTLGYVTPWNSHGYDTAKIFGSKFNYISPVWLQLNRKPGGAFVMGGGHDIDKGWMSDVRKDRTTKIVPRVLFEKWTGNDYKALFTSEDVMEDCIDFLLKYLKKRDFDGIVLEIWSSLGGTQREELTHFINHVAESFHKNNKIFILVLPPPVYAGNSPGLISKKDFDGFSEYIDGYSLMTYDYSTIGRPGANSPIDWIKKCVEMLVPEADSPIRQKILLGLNFYGYKFASVQADPILGHEYIKVLKDYKPKFKWHDDVKEHSIKYDGQTGDTQIWFPSLKSIQERITLATELGTGISIWEIGQGLDYFFDLL